MNLRPLPPEGSGLPAQSRPPANSANDHITDGGIAKLTVRGVPDPDLLLLTKPHGYPRKWLLIKRLQQRFRLFETGVPYARQHFVRLGARSR